MAPRDPRQRFAIVREGARSGLALGPAARSRQDRDERPLDERARERILAEARRNPLALLARGVNLPPLRRDPPQPAPWSATGANVSGAVFKRLSAMG
jgi:hypothetical protein